MVTENKSPILKQFSISVNKNKKLTLYLNKTNGMEQILKYFNNLTSQQISQFISLYDLYLDWNSKINVISRKDIENLYEHHVLHSMAIAQIINFKPGTTVLDVGTGGGFPGIPLAILFPEVKFTLIDSIGKKIKVANEVATAIGLKNIVLKHERAQEEKALFDFVVSRAVMPLEELVKLIRKNITKNCQNRKTFYTLRTPFC